MKRYEKDANGFSPRQIDVLDLLAKQYTYDQMTKELNIRKRTLYAHIVKIMHITGLWKQILLVKYAQEHGYGRKVTSA